MGFAKRTIATATLLLVFFLAFAIAELRTRNRPTAYVEPGISTKFNTPLYHKGKTYPYNLRINWHFFTDLSHTININCTYFDGPYKDKMIYSVSPFNYTANKVCHGRGKTGTNDNYFISLSPGVHAYFKPYNNSGTEISLKRKGFQCTVEAVPLESTDTTSPTVPTCPPSSTTGSTMDQTEGNITTTNPTTVCNCGKKNSVSETDRIVGGLNTTKCDIPWQVELDIGGYLCGGTLIDNQYIITAEHCTYGYTVSDVKSIEFGHLELDGSPDQTATAAKIFHHPNYNANTLEHDISIIKLSEPVTIDNCTSPVCLPKDSDFSDGFVGETSTISGWGATSYEGALSQTLLQVKIPIITNTECQSKYSQFPNAITDNMICAFEYDKDSCQGDSGGPMTVNNNGSEVLVGVVSWGVGCATKPGVYTRVDKYLQWIESETGLIGC